MEDLAEAELAEGFRRVNDTGVGQTDIPSRG